MIIIVVGNGFNLYNLWMSFRSITINVADEWMICPENWTIWSIVVEIFISIIIESNACN